MIATTPPTISDDQRGCQTELGQREDQRLQQHDECSEPEDRPCGERADGDPRLGEFLRDLGAGELDLLAEQRGHAVA